jgi:hypothetical protein
VATQAGDFSGTAAALATTEGSEALATIRAVAINSTLGEGLENLPAGVQLQELTVANDQLTIVGRRVKTD